jgi:hypothetical protein
MRLVKGMLLIGLVISAGAAGYTTVHFEWWSLGLAVLSTAVFWLAFGQIQGRRGASSGQAITEDCESADVVVLDPISQLGVAPRQCDFHTPSVCRPGSHRRQAPSELDRPAA